MPEKAQARRCWKHLRARRQKFAENLPTIALSYELARLRGESFVGRFSMDDFAVPARGLWIADSLIESADQLEEQSRGKDGGAW